MGTTIEAINEWDNIGSMLPIGLVRSAEPDQMAHTHAMTALYACRYSQ